MEKVKVGFQNITLAMKMLYKASPMLYSLQIIINLCVSLNTLIIIWIWKNVIDILLKVTSFENINSDLWIFIILYIGIKAIEYLLGSFSNYIESITDEKFTQNFNKDLLCRVSKLDVSYYDSQEYYDKLSIVKDVYMHISLLSENTLIILKTIISFVGAAIMLGKTYPLAVFLIVLMHIPYTLIQVRNSNKNYKIYSAANREIREKHYYRWLLSGGEIAKDIRLFGYADRIKEMYFKLWDYIEKTKLKLIINNAMSSISGIGFGYISLVIVLIWCTKDAISGNATIGDIQYNIALVTELTVYITTIFYRGSEIFTFSLNEMEAYRNFLEYKDTVDKSGNRQVEKIPKIEFKNIGFKYPNLNKWILRNLNFTINSGEKIAIVGLNGAGKTTIVKLLLRFYEPQEGDILINDINIKEYDITNLREKFGTLLQEYGKYDFTLKENITMMDETIVNSSNLLKMASFMSGVDELIKDWEKGFDTSMSRNFDLDGQELSGGQWQKVALARAFYRNGDIVILDEPSSALDPEAEHHIFTKFMELSQDKGAILISHRLTNITMVDRIIVVEGGKCIETGSHEELMKENGRYAYLYKLQASKYINSNCSAESI